MGSDSHFHPDAKRSVIAGTLLLAGASWTAGMFYPAPALLAGCAMAATLAAMLLKRGLRALVPAAHAMPIEVPVGVPQETAALTAQLLVLEAQLEHAPIALFRIDAATASDAVSPVNAHARRLLAPGRATDAGDLFGKLAVLIPGRRDLIEFGTERGVERAIAIATAVTVEGAPQRIATLLPVENELEAEAMQAWQKLVHVLTHEIMNSLTPVASLSRTARELLADAEGKLPDDAGQDIDLALDTIGRRAASLIHFVGGYRTLASVPAAQPQAVAVVDMFARLAVLVAPTWEARGGKAEFSVEPASLELMVDPGQFEQAMINLLKNAEEATNGLAVPEVVVSARLSRGGRLRIEIRDNGPGVKDESIPHIFTPFFSTKDRGSGIGLAMVRQLVHRNGGTVRYAKPVGAGACFVIAF